MAVYFIQAVEGGPIKIGFAQDPQKRLAEIQRMSPVPLQVLKVIPGDRNLEGAIHLQKRRKNAQRALQRV